MDEPHPRRRRLRLGALLFRLHYYMQEPADIAAGIYRRAPDTYVQALDGHARIVDGARVEIVSMEEAIIRCKEALATGRPLQLDEQ